MDYNLKKLGIFFKFVRCVLKKLFKTIDKLIMVFSPLDNSLEIFVLSSWKSFVCERGYLVMIFAQFSPKSGKVP